MFSDLFTLGPLTIHAYGLCMAIGFLLAWKVACLLCKKTGQSSDFLSSLIVWLMAGSIFGARVAYVLEHWTAEFRDHPLAIFRLDQGGLMFYGGFIGAVLVQALYSRITKRRFLSVTDLLVAVLPLGHTFGRLGCFFHGCCYGRISQCFLAVSFPSGSPAWWEQVQKNLITQEAERSLPVLPTQLFESVTNLVLFVVLFSLYPRHREKTGFLTALYFCAYAVIRFCMEFLRGDPRMAIGPFSIGQVISFSLFLPGVLLLFSLSRRKA